MIAKYPGSLATPQLPFIQPGASAALRGAEQTRWLPEHLEMLGKIPDGDIAALVDCSIGTVSQKRKELSLGPYKRKRLATPTEHQWPEFESLPQHEFFVEIRRMLSEY